MAKINPLKKEIISLLDPEVIEDMEQAVNNSPFKYDPFDVLDSRKEVLSTWRRKYNKLLDKAEEHGNKDEFDEITKKVQCLNEASRSIGV
jgi:hypothetical protein